MNLPTNVIATGKAALQSSWDDVATIKRKSDVLVNHTRPLITVYENIKCHFSQTSQPVLDQSNTVATTKSIFTLFVDTPVVLKSGDTIIVTHKGQTFEGAAGQPFNRNFSNSVKVEVEKVT